MTKSPKVIHTKRVTLFPRLFQHVMDEEPENKAAKDFVDVKVVGYPVFLRLTNMEINADRLFVF